jgi:hypothetical protein
VTKKLSLVGEGTPLEIETDGEALILHPAKTLSQMDQVIAAADEIMDAHEETLRKLAQ